MSGRSSRWLLPCLLIVGGLLGSTASAQDAQQRRGFSVSITEPANQQVIFGKTKIAAKVKIKDPDLVDRVEFHIRDDVVFVDREPPYEYYHDFGEESASWIIRVVAWHREGVAVSDAVITRRIQFSTIERVNRVILWVAATDKKDNLVTDLAVDDFVLMENGTPQKILDFHSENRPITMAILIDTSGSMHGEKIAEVHKAAGAFVESLRPMDQALIIDFDDNVFMIQGLTADHEALKEAIESTEAIGGTSIFDALHAAYRKIGEFDGRKVIVLLSDGRDETSQTGFKRVVNEAKTNTTMIYSIALGGSLGSGVDTTALEEFAEVTGGRFFLVKKAEDLAGVYQRIAEELGKQYYLTYATTNQEWDGHWIKIKVDSKRDGVKVRARRGYFAVRDQSR